MLVKFPAHLSPEMPLSAWWVCNSDFLQFCRFGHFNKSRARQPASLLLLLLLSGSESATSASYFINEYRALVHAARSHSARYFSFISICAATILMVYSFVYDIHTYMYEYGKCLFVFFQQIAGINICCFCCSWVLLFATFKCFTFNFLTADCWLLSAYWLLLLSLFSAQFFITALPVVCCCCPLLLLLSFSRERVKFANVFMHCSHFFSRSRSHRHEYLFMHVCPYAYIMHS